MRLAREGLKKFCARMEAGYFGEESEIPEPRRAPPVPSATSRSREYNLSPNLGVAAACDSALAFGALRFPATRTRGACFRIMGWCAQFSPTPSRVLSDVLVNIERRRDGERWIDSRVRDSARSLSRDGGVPHTLFEREREREREMPYRGVT